MISAYLLLYLYQMLKVFFMTKHNLFNFITFQIRFLIEFIYIPFLLFGIYFVLFLFISSISVLGFTF
jgi:hypothetical protein